MNNSLIVSVIFFIFSSFVIHAEHWPTGYYQEVDDEENSFYYNDEYRWYCHIQNDTQASLYNVAAQVRKVGDISFLSQGTCLAECPWPNGFYRSEDGPIYLLYPGNICTITSDEMLDAYGGTGLVVVGENNSEFGAQRNFIGQCFWPSY